MRLDLVVGPNGAGKSTFVAVHLRSQHPTTPFVNADAIAAERWPADPEGHSYEAARVAAETRSLLIGAGRPFIAETVFSHPSKLDLVRDARAAGFAVALHVLFVPEQLVVERVLRRVAAGGHSVPENKIRERYHRLWPLVAEAVLIADTARVWRNDRRERPVLVARFRDGVPSGACSWPVWTPEPLRATAP